MTAGRSIVINGDLGSGKSTVAAGLATRLGLRRVAMGDVHREMAQSLQMTTLELNQRAEADKAIDDYVDQVQKDLAASGEQLVVDSRLGWHFFTDAFKVHLITDPTEAARRVISRPANAVEGYSSLEEAREMLERRSDSERVRFIERYGVDKYDLRNYDVVCDTTRASADEVVELLAAAFGGEFGREVLDEAPPLLLIDPARIFPSRESAGLGGPEDEEFVAGVGERGPKRLEPILAGYSGKCFCVIDGHRRLAAALRNGFTLVPGRLIGQGEEPVVGDSSADEYFAAHVTAELVAAWEEAYQVRLPALEDCARAE